MRRCVISIMVFLVISACGRAPTPTPDLAATPTPGVEIGTSTRTAIAPADTRPPTTTRTLAPAATYTRTASQTANPTPMPIPTVVTSTRSHDGMTMVYVAAGSFTMGSPPGLGSDEEAPPHKVTLDGFWIDRTEVTNAQYRAFVIASGYRTPTICERGNSTYDDAGKENHPVVCVSWDDARAYCEWAGARLPTEAEWEEAARGTDSRNYPWGMNFDGSRLNFCDINCDSDQKDPGANDGYAQTAPVGSYPMGVSPYGALDMAGNVWEWVSDWYSFYYYGRSPQSNPQGPNSGEYRVLRGGSWFGSSSNARTAFRAWLHPDQRDSAIGFRCIVPSKLSP
jgi:formylglycine-generating enzyme required for sulfatase activity